ncbi:MAG: hypothetical protein ABI586_07200 [Candidatus Nanopelagicales bacterium]
MSGITPPPPPPPSTPPPSTPPPVGGQPFDAGEAISYGWKGLTKYLGPLLLIALIVAVISIASSVVGYFFDSLLLQLLWNVVTTIISLVIGMGLIRAALAVVDGRVPEVGMLFRTENFIPYLLASILVGLSVGIGLVLCIIPGLILAFLFAFYGYAIVDGRTSDGIESMKISWNLVKENVGQLVLLFFLLLLINIVGAILCGIGLLFTYPLTAVALAYAWRRLSGGPIAALA